VSAQIRQDHAVARGQRLRRRNPEFMMCGKRMEKHQRRAVAQDCIGDFGAAATLMHAGIVNAACPASKLNLDSGIAATGLLPAAKSARRSNVRALPA
jgi:hypothetical protein